jgi:YggT family protein
MRIVYLIVEIYLYVLIARIVLSWFPMRPDSPVMPVVKVLGAVTDPVLKPLRKVLPPLNVGGMGIDLSPILLCVALEIILLVLS